MFLSVPPRIVAASALLPLSAWLSSSAAPAQRASPPGITRYAATSLAGVPPAAAKPILPFAAPLFLAGRHFASVLSLVNNATDATDADLTLRDPSGHTILTPHLDFKPHSQQQLDLGSLLQQSGSPATRGSLVVRQSASLQGRAIMGTLAVTYDSPGGPVFIDEEPPDPNVAVSSALVGVVDPSSGAPLLAVASLAASAQHIQVECFGERGAFTGSPVTLLPGQTSIAAACSTQNPQDGEAGDSDLFLAEPGGGSQGPLGIRLLSDGAPGAFTAFALAPHIDDGNRSFSAVLFSDPQAAHSSGIVFAGVPVGPASLLPSGTYTPHISLANFSTTPLHVRTTFAHTGEGETTTTPQEVSTVTLDPGASREITLEDLPGDTEMRNSFIVASDGAPGALGAKLVALGEGPLLRRLELQAKDEGSRQNAGGHPWSVEDGTESTLLLFNHGSKPRHFTVSIAGSESWQKTWTLASMETKAISLRDLIESRTADDSGRTLSPAVGSGEASWFVPDSTESTGRLLQSNRTTGMARNYSCGFSNLLCGSSVQIYQSTFPDGSVADFADITGITCTSGSYTACSGQQTGTGGYYITKWTAGSPNIAPISGSNANPSVNLLGAAAGSSLTTGLIKSSYCASAGGGIAVVGCPVSVTLSALDPIGINHAYPYQTGYGAMAEMQTNPTSENWSAAQIYESVTAGTNNCPTSIAGGTDPNNKNNGIPFRVGGSAQAIEDPSLMFNAKPDIFYDEHGLIAQLDLLGLTASPPSSCQTVSHQIYTCNGATIGSFTITKTFTHGKANGYPATIVTVDKK